MEDDTLYICFGSILLFDLISNKKLFQLIETVKKVETTKIADKKSGNKKPNNSMKLNSCRWGVVRQRGQKP